MMQRIIIASMVSMLCITPLMHAQTVAELKKEADTAAEREEFDRAIPLYMQCVAADHSDIRSSFNGALCMLKVGRIDEAIAIFDDLSLRVHNSESLRYNMAYAYKTAGNLDTAIAIYEELLTKNPDYDAAQLGLGFAYLQNGDFIHGWPQHSKSLIRMGKNGDQLRELLRTNSIADNTILLHYEGGLGDTIMFIRYAERIKQLGGTTLCMVQKQLVPLLAQCPYIDILVPYTAAFVQPHAARASLMSMPAIFEDTEETFPLSIPYIFPDAALVKEWQTRIAQYPGIKIGLCWQADVFNDSSRLPIARRGIPLKALEPILHTPHCTFFSLQRFDGTEQLKELDPACSIIEFPDLDTEHGCFMDTAALIKNLDLVIAIDSAVAHLAGALGVPTLLLLPYVPDWRWLHNRTDSPWYPQHLIFKQPAPFDWDPVVAAVATYLEAFHPLKKDC